MLQEGDGVMADRGFLVRDLLVTKKVSFAQPIVKAQDCQSKVKLINVELQHCDPMSKGIFCN